METRQRLEENYFVIYPERSRDNTTGRFDNSYISDGVRFRMELHCFFGEATIEQDATTITCDGETQCVLTAPGQVLTVTKGPLSSVSPLNGESVASPYLVFYDRNPLITLYHCQNPLREPEVRLFSLDRYLQAGESMAQLAKKASWGQAANGSTSFATLTYSFAKGKPGTYAPLVTWEMKITSASLVDALPELFTIDTSLARAIYDPKSGRQTAVKTN